MITKAKNQFGFTLNELLVVIFIITLFSTSVAISYSNSQRQYAVSMVAQRLMSDIRRAQNLALSGRVQGAVVPNRYGISVLSGTQYQLFYNADTGASGVVDTITLSNATLSPVGASIDFSSPEATISGPQTFVIVNGSHSKRVMVDSSGVVSIN